jgi:taurine dioxygenase
MSGTPQIIVRKLTPAIGAVLSGVDISQPLSKETKAAIEKALVENHVIFFENQHNLTPETHREFAKQFGPLHTHPYFPNLKDQGVPELIVFDTHIKNPPDSNNWHTDVTFEKTPPLGCVLRAIQTPAVGGDTCWASTVAAYNALSPSFQTLLDGLTATHDFSKAFPPERWGKGNEEEGRRIVAMHPPVSHPVVRVHPVTGQKCVFAGGFVTKINDVSREESDAIIRLLREHVGKPEFIVRWQWKKGDVAFWDNRSTQHYAVADYLPERRIMNRATIIGDVPYGPSEKNENRNREQ